MSIHDFGLAPSWAGFIAGADRLALDTHPYVAFNGQPNTQPISTSTGADAGGIWPALACTGWGDQVNTSQTAFGVTVAGEFSNAVNDCGLFVKARGIAVTYGGDCAYWEDATQWNATTRAGIQAWAMASMDAFQNWFFWTWKVTYSVLQWAFRCLLMIYTGWQFDSRLSSSTALVLPAWSPAWVHAHRSSSSYGQMCFGWRYRHSIRWYISSVANGRRWSRNDSPQRLRCSYSVATKLDQWSATGVVTARLYRHRYCCDLTTTYIHS